MRDGNIEPADIKWKVRVGWPPTPIQGRDGLAFPDPRGEDLAERVVPKVLLGFLEELAHLGIVGGLGALV